MRLREVKGAIHVHTRYSDGSGSVEEVIEAARSAGLDFCILADHDTVEAADNGYGRRYGGVLIVVGAEISPARRGHCLALGAHNVTGYKWMPEKFFLRKLQRDGADTYVAHPEGRVKPTFGINLRQWHAWEEEKFTGLEIWSYMHDWVENLTYLKLPHYYRHPEEAIDGPDRRVLGLWDRLNMHRRVVGIGALDAHAVKMLFGFLVAFRYEALFRTVLTHVFVDEWDRGAEADTRELLRSLREGRAFVAHEGVGPAEGFDFHADKGAVMGTRSEFAGSASLYVRTPQRAVVSLIHNGRCGGRRTGTDLEFTITQPGVYRAEVRRGGRPWIYSNPIFFAHDARA